MEVILKDDVKGLGFKNDIVEVKPGYGRNYLIPQGIAVMADKANKKIVAENIRQASHKAEKLRIDAQAVADQIGDQVFELRAK
ncbi:MAG: 50S ribosomal protein L9, partial [Bacteroidota bacterium]|nr:50S ribosomal protein L9 [Bacteroidota bacterium]